MSKYNQGHNLHLNISYATVTTSKHSFNLRQVKLLVTYHNALFDLSVVNQSEDFRRLPLPILSLD